MKYTNLRTKVLSSHVTIHQWTRKVLISTSTSSLLLWALLGVEPGAPRMLPVQPVHYPHLESGAIHLSGSRWKSVESHQPGRAQVHPRWALHEKRTLKHVQYSPKFDILSGLAFFFFFYRHKCILSVPALSLLLLLSWARSTGKCWCDGVDWAEPP